MAYCVFIGRHAASSLQRQNNVNQYFKYSSNCLPLSVSVFHLERHLKVTLPLMFWGLLESQSFFSDVVGFLLLRICIRIDRRDGWVNPFISHVW
jgi:hypothetical protein